MTAMPAQTLSAIEHIPKHLESNQEYPSRVRHNGCKPEYQSVRFIGFTTCPVVIIVSDRDGQIQRVSRMDYSKLLLRDETDRLLVV